MESEKTTKSNIHVVPECRFRCRPFHVGESGSLLTVFSFYVCVSGVLRTHIQAKMYNITFTVFDFHNGSLDSFHKKCGSIKRDFSCNVGIMSS